MTGEIRINLLLKESIYPELYHSLIGIPEKDRAEKVRSMLNELVKGFAPTAQPVSLINRPQPEAVFEPAVKKAPEGVVGLGALSQVSSDDFEDF